MGVCVRLILPDRDEGVQAEILDRIVSRWDGVTVTRGFGLWNSPKGRHRDPILVLECSIHAEITEIECWPEWWVWWNELAKIVRIQSGETCVFLSVRSETGVLVYADRTERIGE